MLLSKRSSANQFYELNNSMHYFVLRFGEMQIIAYVTPSEDVQLFSIQLISALRAMRRLKTLNMIWVYNLHKYEDI